MENKYKITEDKREGINVTWYEVYVKYWWFPFIWVTTKFPLGDIYHDLSDAKRRVENLKKYKGKEIVYKD